MSEIKQEDKTEVELETKTEAEVEREPLIEEKKSSTKAVATNTSPMPLQLFSLECPEDDGEMYVVLQETSQDYNESWMTFIKIRGNEVNIQLLADQLNSIDENRVDEDDEGISIFDIDIEHPICKRTAKEMSNVELNYKFFHRKFDGVLRKIDFHFKRSDTDWKRIKKVNKKLGHGKIEDYVSEEDVDSDLLESVSEDSSEEESSSEKESSNSDIDENCTDDMAQEVEKKVKGKVVAKPKKPAEKKIEKKEEKKVDEKMKSIRERERKERREKQIKKTTEKKESGRKEER